MATTPNYGWVTPAPSNFVTNLPADFETFADAVDADLAGLLGGTTGQVLTKDSNTDHDFSWQDAAGGVAGFTLLNTGGTALTGAASITVSGISNQAQLYIIVHNASSVNASSYLDLTFNADTGSNYAYHGVEIDFISSGSGTSNYFVDNYWRLARMGDSAANQWRASVMVEGCASTSAKVGTILGGGTGANSSKGLFTHGIYTGSSTISSVTVSSSTGNFDAGTIYVYGSAN